VTSVRLDNISRRFGNTIAVREMTLQIAPGELFFLVGPSGCGKSTLLRLIAGLDEPSGGRIFFNDEDVTHLPTQQRNAVMCFQSYALWPHISVREHIRFGLSIRRIDRAEQEPRIERVLGLVQMRELADRKPNQLSGGQQQRVALARALAVEPRCLLLDEPLSNLDAKLRHEMRSEIRRICKSAEFTTIYVTHDQKEALSIADRIAILKDGRLMQVGTPAELYNRPKSAFVADFIGSTNLLSGTVLGRSGRTVRIHTAAGDLNAVADTPLPQNVMLSIRPERMRIAREAAADGRNRITGRPVETTFLGDSSEHVLEVNGLKVRFIAAPPLFEVPESISVEFGAEDVVVVEGTAERE